MNILQTIRENSKRF